MGAASVKRSPIPCFVPSLWLLQMLQRETKQWAAICCGNTREAGTCVCEEEAGLMLRLLIESVFWDSGGLC